MAPLQAAILALLSSILEVLSMLPLVHASTDGIVKASDQLLLSLLLRSFFHTFPFARLMVLPNPETSLHSKLDSSQCRMKLLHSLPLPQ